MKQILAVLAALTLVVPFQATAQESAPLTSLISCLSDAPYTKSVDVRQESMTACTLPIFTQCAESDHNPDVLERYRAGYVCLMGISARLQGRMYDLLHNKFPNEMTIAHQLRKLPLDHGLKLTELECEYARAFSELRYKPWENKILSEDADPLEFAKAHCLLREYAELYWYLFVHDHLE